MFLSLLKYCVLPAFLCCIINPFRAEITYVDVVPDVVLDITAFGPEYIIPNPFGGADLHVQMGVNAIVIHGEYFEPAAVTVMNDMLAYWNCGDMVGPTSNVWIDGWDFAPVTGDFYAGIVFANPGGDLFYGWVHFTIDMATGEVTIMEYAYEDELGTGIEICDVGGVDNEVCGNGIDDDMDGDVDFNDSDCPCNLTTADFEALNINESGSLCTENWLLSATAPFATPTYEWYQNGVLIPGANEAVLNMTTLGLSSDTYQALAVNTSNCASQEINVVADDLEGEVVIIDPGSICGLSQFELQSVNTSGLLLDYLWSTLDGNIISAPNEASLSINQSGTYSLNIAAGPCTNEVSLNVTFSSEAPPIPSFNSDIVRSCEEVQVSLVSTSTGVGELFFEWTIPDLGVFSDENVQFESTVEGTQEIIFEVTDEAGCSAEIVEQIDIEFRDELEIVIDMEIDEEFLSVSFNVLAENQDLSSTWDFGDGTTSNANNIVHEYLEGGEYLVQLISTDSYGCEANASRTLRIIEQVQMFIPNAFTPNGDGYNDIWKWAVRGADELLVEIYDQNSKLIFESNEIDFSWNGSVNGGDYIAEDGIYQFRIKARSNGGTWEEQTGAVTLIR